MKLLYVNHETCANQLLLSKLVSFIPTQCVNQCQLDCIRDGSTILQLRGSQLAKTNLAPLRIWFCHTFNKLDQIAKLSVMLLLVDKKKIDCFSVDGICYHCNTVFEAMGCYYHYCHCQEARPSLTDTNFERGVKKRQQDGMRRPCKKQKGYRIVEMWECEWWSLFKTDASVKNHLRKNIPY